MVGAGGGGIGTAIAQMLAAEGAVVTAVDRDSAALAELEKSIHELGGRCVPHLGDAGIADQARQMVRSAAESDAPLCGLVNVVGGLPIDRWQNLLDYPEDTFDVVIDSNLKVALQTSRAFARELSEVSRFRAAVNSTSVRCCNRVVKEINADSKSMADENITPATTKMESVDVVSNLDALSAREVPNQNPCNL